MAETFYRKKLIDISMPLEAINEASVAEKFIRTGHPSVLHQWWSRKPLVAARAVLFASLVDDPSEYLDEENKIVEERERLLKLLRQLAQWEMMYQSLFCQGNPTGFLTILSNYLLR